MSKLEELIKQLCPNGVKYKRLDEVFESFNGMTGVSNKWKENGNCQFIEYMNAYKNLKINIKLLPFATVKNLQQNTLQKGDILLTCASETPDECAVSSVIEDEIKDNVFLDDHLFGIRVKKDMKSEINTTFINYYMHTNNFRKKINKAVRGVTRFYISIEEFMKICIPVPPLEVQCEIVHILDDFTLLSAELSAELKARQKQYEYYNYNLLKFENIPYYTLEELCDIVDYRGKTPKKTNEGIFLVTAKNIRKGYIDYEKSQEFISEQDYAEVMRRGMPKVGDVLITTEAPCGNVAQVDDENIALAQRVIKYRPKDNRLDSTFFKYILLGEEFQTKLNGKATGGTVKGIKGSILHKLTIPLPSIEEQRKIVKILDRFNKLCNDISEGLPAEINARQKQYEYYRDKLLTFKELKVNE